MFSRVGNQVWVASGEILTLDEAQEALKQLQVCVAEIEAAQQSAHPTPLESAVNPATWVINPKNITPPEISG